MSTVAEHSFKNLTCPDANKMHLWRLNLSVPHSRMKALRHLLSSCEVAESLKLKNGEDRQRFVVRRARRRQILAVYIGCDPGEVTYLGDEFLGKSGAEKGVILSGMKRGTSAMKSKNLAVRWPKFNGKIIRLRSQAPCAQDDMSSGLLSPSQNRKGKPKLLNNNLCFSASHSCDTALLAVAPFEIGIDIEEVRTEIKIDEVAQKYFGRELSSQLEKLAPAPKIQKFFEMWVAHEAVCKAEGCGLVEGPLDFMNDYHVKLINLPAPFVAAVASKKKSPRLVFKDYDSV